MLSFAQLAWFTLAILLYRIFIFRSGWFQLNRSYLLCILLATLCLPYLSHWLPTQALRDIFPNEIIAEHFLTNEVAEHFEDIPAQPRVAALEAEHPSRIPSSVQSIAPIQENLTPKFLFTVLRWANIIYWAGTVIFMLRLMWSHLQLWRIIKSAHPLTESNSVIKDGQSDRGYVLAKGKNIAFTYWHCYFVSPNLPRQNNWPHVKAHEQAHARGLHTLDIFLADLFCCFCWYFPPVWWYRRALRNNLEYLADQIAIRKVDSKKSYFLSLLAIQQSSDVSPAVAFAAHPLKTRIMMLQTRAISPFYYLLRTLLTLLPLTFLAVACSESFEEQLATEQPDSDNYEIYITESLDFDGMAELQYQLGALGAQLYVSLGRDNFSHLKVTHQEYGDRLQLNGLNESGTPIRISLNPSAGVCDLHYYYDQLPAGGQGHTIQVFRNGAPYDIPVVPLQPKHPAFHLDHNQDLYGNQIFKGPTAWEDAHQYAAGKFPDLTIRYDYNDHPSHQQISSPPTDLKYINVRLTYNEPPQVRMMLQTEKFKLVSEVHSHDLLEEAKKLVKPHPALGLKYDFVPLNQYESFTQLRELLVYAYSGATTNFYLGGQLVNEGDFKNAYENLSQLAVVKSYLDDEPVVVAGIEW